MLEPDQVNNGLGEAGQQHGADEGPGNGPRESEVIICTGQFPVDVGCWCPVHEHIMSCLNGEGLLYLGIGSDNKMKQNKAGYQCGQKSI